jgi:RimJ/RimL family protein N-acetyltransferase
MNQAPPSPSAYRIETERLVLEAGSPLYAEAMKRAIDGSLEHLSNLAWLVDEPTSIERKIEKLRGFRAAFDRGEHFPYHVLVKDHPGEVAGGAGLMPRVGAKALEIGYWLAAPYVGKGYMREAAAALTRVAVEIHGCLRVEIHCDPENVRSANVARKLGYTHDATLRKRLLQTDGTLRDTMIWSILAVEIPGSPVASVAYRAFDAAGRPI